jgi:hypothetical protein
MANHFPDLPYLDRIRAALWRRGGHGDATVMVGSGLSLNAHPQGGGNRRFPTWPDLARTVVNHLYPPDSARYSDHRVEALKLIGTTSGFLRVAQEYEIAFGRDELERLVADSVPDLTFEPGDLHRRLLALPWADVLTTNWDTLLERAAAKVVDRHYDLVRTVPDIPITSRPRIVKLHGTLPATRPLVFTEEDYRTYPARFAPFVNLAQQSMMESIFCLVGFSGDDPNFLYWSGWVRDHLADHAPRIYLVGWLSLSPPRRRMLESRGVIPIDLSRLVPPVPWPDETKHQRALEWFLSCLEEAEPYSEMKWPSHSHSSGVTHPAYLPAIPASYTAAPRAEKPGPENSPEVGELWDTIEVWRYNRGLFPGWIIAPPSARLRLWRFTELWIPAVLNLLPALAPSERIEVLEELNWRLETSLIPLSCELATAIADALSKANPREAAPPSPSKTGASPLQAWVTLATALLRASREADDHRGVDRWAEALAPHIQDFSWLRPRVAYERCLLALGRLDHAAVERALEDLEDSSHDIFWKVRRAGVLAELGMTAESYRVAGEALPEIRAQIGHGPPDISVLSREGWAMMLADGFSFYPPPRTLEEGIESRNPPRGLEPRERTARRWEVLRRHGCDAREDFFETIRSVMADPPGPEPEVTEKLGFDPGYKTRIDRGRTWRSRGHGWEHLPGLQAMRLVEEAGLPPEIDNVGVSTVLRLRAAVWVEDRLPNMALGSILRVSSYGRDGGLDDFLHRCRVAVLGEALVKDLVTRVERALDYSVPRAAAALTENDTDRMSYWVGRIRVGVEVLSRLVLRLEAEKAEQILDKALEFYKLPLFRQHYWLAEPLANLCYRSISSIPLLRLQDRLADLLALPIPLEGDFRIEAPGDWPDPFRMAAARFGVAGAPLPTDGNCAETISRLTATAGSTPQHYPRWPAINRLVTVFRWGWLTGPQREQFGEAIWSHRLPKDGFPEGPWPRTNANHFLYLHLPCSEPGLAERLFRQQYLPQADANRSAPLSEDYLRNLLGVTEIRLGDAPGLILSPSEADEILARIIELWRSGQLREAVENSGVWSSVFDLESFKSAFASVVGRVLLPRLDANSAYIDDTATMVSDLRGLDFPVEAAYPALAHLRPRLLPELTDRMRQSLVSSNREQAEGAVNAVWWWLDEGKRFGLKAPSSDLVREIAIAISMRRPMLQRALEAAAWALQEGVLVERERFARLVSEGLGYLLTEARYETGLENKAGARLRPNEVSVIRACCVKIAVELDRAGFGHFHPVSEWIREGSADPFPEIRQMVARGGDTMNADELPIGPGSS